MAIIGINPIAAEENRRHEERARKDRERLATYPTVSLDEAAHRERVRRATATGVITMSASQNSGDPVAQMEAQIKAHRDRHAGTPYADAMRAVANANPDLAERARVASTPQVGPGGVPLAPPPSFTSSSVVQFDALVNDYRTKNPSASYADAIVAVAKQNPELAEKRRAEFSGVVTL